MGRAESTRLGRVLEKGPGRGEARWREGTPRVTPSLMACEGWEWEAAWQSTPFPLYPCVAGGGLLIIQLGPFHGSLGKAWVKVKVRVSSRI